MQETLPRSGFQLLTIFLFPRWSIFPNFPKTKAFSLLSSFNAIKICLRAYYSSALDTVCSFLINKMVEIAQMSRVFMFTSLCPHLWQRSLHCLFLGLYFCAYTASLCFFFLVLFGTQRLLALHLIITGSL